MLRNDRTQVVKWTTEGAVKGKCNRYFLSILRRDAYVSCREYVGIPQSAGEVFLNQGGTTEEVVFRPCFCRFYDDGGKYGGLFL